MSVFDGPGEGTWSVFAQKVVEQREELLHKLAGRDAHIKSLEGLLVDAVRERDVLLEYNERLLSDLHDALDRVVTQEDSARAIYDMAAEVAAQRERDAEVRGARWGLDVALDARKWPVSKWTPEEVCRDAREQGEQ